MFDPDAPYEIVPSDEEIAAFFRAPWGFWWRMPGRTLLYTAETAEALVERYDAADNSH